MAGMATGKLENIYLHCPLAVQKVLVNLQGSLVQCRRYDKQFERALVSCIQRSHFGQSELEEYQKGMLRRTLLSAAKTSFWKALFSECGVNPAAEHIVSELQKLPILTKEVVKERVGDFRHPDFGDKDTMISHTSGTTGSGLIFPMTLQSEHFHWAVWWRYRMWHGITREMWCGYFGGRSIVPLKQQKPPYWRINHAARQVMFSAYHLSEETANAYMGALRESAVAWLHGYPSTLAMLAAYVREAKLPRLPKLRIITTGAESLLSNQRKALNEAFGVPIRQHYCLSEGVANISECEQGHLHVDEDFSHVEFVPIANEPHAFKIVGTNYSNPAFPLIRYDTGDIATLSYVTCTCGRVGRVVFEIDGRKEDYVTLPGGSRVGRLDHIFKDMVNVREAQIHQEDESHLTFRIVKTPGFNEKLDAAQLMKEARKRLGEEVEIRFEYVEQIPRTKAGKLRLVVSDIAANKVRGQ